MQVNIHKNCVKVTGISNEAQMDEVVKVADLADSQYEVADFGCMVIVTTNLDAFCQEWDQ